MRSTLTLGMFVAEKADIYNAYILHSDKSKFQRFALVFLHSSNVLAT